MDIDSSGVVNFVNPSVLFKATERRFALVCKIISFFAVFGCVDGRSIPVRLACNQN